MSQSAPREEEEEEEGGRQHREASGGAGRVPEFLLPTQLGGSGGGAPGTQTSRCYLSEGAAWPKLDRRRSGCQGWGRETAAAAATRGQGRCLSPTSELFAPTSPCVLSRSPKTPALGPEPVRRDTVRALVLADPQAASAPVQARPPPAGAGNHFLFGPNFGDCQLPGPARVSLNFSGASSPRKTARGTRGEGRRGSARRPGPGHGPGCTPACPGVGGAGRREEGVRVTSLVPPLPITASAPPTCAP